MHPTVKTDVVWDGIRVYRVPSPGEIEAIRLLSVGYSTRQASEVLGMRTEDVAGRRANEAQAKMHGCSHADTLCRMYRLGLMDNPYDPRSEPVLDDYQRHLLDVVARMGLSHDHASVLLGVARGTLGRRIRQVYRLLGAHNRVQAMACAVRSGDVTIDPPAQLWRGEV